MYPSERQDRIMDILNEQRYVSVRFLEEKLHYSNATISRDISALVRQGLVEKTYGGVTLIDKGIIPRTVRRSYGSREKGKIAEKASEYISDGDTIFLDGSTTTQMIAQHLSERKNLTIVTNNAELACILSATDTKVIVLGGEIVEFPGIVSGDLAVDNAGKLKIDKMFFSTYSFTNEGEITAKVNTFYQMLRALLRASRRVFYLADSKKCDLNASFVITTFENVDCVISDYVFDDTLKMKYPSVEFPVLT